MKKYKELLLSLSNSYISSKGTQITPLKYLYLASMDLQKIDIEKMDEVEAYNHYYKIRGLIDKAESNLRFMQHYVDTIKKIVELDNEKEK